MKPVIKQDNNGITIDLTRYYKNAGEFEEYSPWEDIGYKRYDEKYKRNRGRFYKTARIS